MPCASPPVDLVDTLLFVDIDGVLNVGIRDGAKPPLLLDESSVRSALRLREECERHPERDSIERLVAVLERDCGDGEEPGVTFSKLTSASPNPFSDVLVNRFAQLVRCSGWQPPRDGGGGAAAAAAAANPRRGGRVRCVLTSTWRSPQHRARLEKLEAAVSRHLGMKFEFDEKTQAKEDHSPEGRLRSIGQFLGSFCERRCGEGLGARPLRVVVLDDFYNRPLDGWSCAGRSISSRCDVEQYLRGCAPAASDTQVMMLHTYTEWSTPRGLSVQVGSGLTVAQLQGATRFLAGQQASAAAPRGTAAEAAAVAGGGGARPDGGEQPHRPAASDSILLLPPPKSPGGAACSEEKLQAIDDYFAPPWPQLPLLAL